MYKVKIILFPRMFLFYTIISIIILFTIGISMNSSQSIILFANAQNKQEVNKDCIVRGNVDSPSPLLVLRWTINGECDSTIDYYIHFYDIKAVVPFHDVFLLFLET
jgi:hypothetical protein